MTKSMTRIGTAFGAAILTVGLGSAALSLAGQSAESGARARPTRRAGGPDGFGGFGRGRGGPGGPVGRWRACRSAS